MVLTAQTSDSSDVCITARGNFSLDAGGLLNLLLALGAVTLGLAAALAWQGYWPILLIAVIQIILVAWILVKAWQRSWVVERIVIAHDRIGVTHQRHRQVQCWDLDAAWAVVEMETPRVAWYGPRVTLRSRGTRVELGQFLTQAEREQLAAQLRQAIRNYSVLAGASQV